MTVLFYLFTSIMYCFLFITPATGSSECLITSRMNKRSANIAIDIHYLSGIIGVVAIYRSLDWVLRARKTFDLSTIRPAHWTPPLRYLCVN